jgi:hypothetical protein
MKFYEEINCPNQSIDKLNWENEESLLITISSIPFLTFRIKPLNINHFDGVQKYELTSDSPISLRSYEELEGKYPNRSEKWGEYTEIGDCINKAINVTAGFTNGLKTGEINEGNYYEDER